MRYLKLNEAIYLHSRVIEKTGRSAGLRDFGALESALAQPKMTFGGTELYPDLTAKAAALCYSLIQNHPFVDGNKCIGHAAMLTFVDGNKCIGHAAMLTFLDIKRLPPPSSPFSHVQRRALGGVAGGGMWGKGGGEAGGRAGGAAGWRGAGRKRASHTARGRRPKGPPTDCTPPIASPPAAQYLA